MPNTLRVPLATAVVCAVLSLALLFVAPTSAAAQSTTVVISQVYGGGGNQNATYKNDFIELFNLSSAPVSLAGWSVQYASATGSSWQVTALSGVLQPGQYYLVQEAKGNGGVINLQPDAVGVIPMSATAGKVALVNTTAALTVSCPIGAGTVDFVGFGSTANCFEGSGPTATLSNTTAAQRPNACFDTDNNSTDFAVIPMPLPRNKASLRTPCAMPTPPKGVGAASVNPVEAGTPTLLTVNVTPGSNPISTGLAVTMDLTPVKGTPQIVTLYDDGTNGDVTAGDRLFSSDYLVPLNAPAGDYTIWFTVSDAQLRSTTDKFVLTVRAAPIPLAIHDIQGSGTISPYKDKYVLTTGIVTVVVYNGFYIEAPDNEWDASLDTSEGVFVYTNSKPTVQVGDSVEVKGVVSEYYTVTEITGPTVVATFARGVDLPPVVNIAPATNGTPDQYERYEGMLVRLANPNVVGPTGTFSSGSNDGKFYVTAAGVPRPFREPGLAPDAPAITGMPIGVPHYDGNPERVFVDSSSCTTPAVAAVGDTVSEVTGALSFYNGDLAVYGCPSVSNVVSSQPLPARGDREFTIATFNMQNFTSDATRLTKASLAIRNIVGAPDIIGVEEVDSLATLQALAAQISSDATAAGKPDPGYTAQMLAPAASQNLGILYRASRMTNVDITEVGRYATFPDPRPPYNQMTTNDRPPLVMTAKLLPPIGQPFPVTIIVNHMRSLIDVDTASGTGDFARAKRQACAEFLANLIAEHQAAGENVISVGDYNAYEFNDGYVDVLGTVIGHPTPADQVLLASSDLVDPDAVDTITLLQPAGRYSYVENGSAQDLDHIVVSSGLLERFFHLEIAHNNADFPRVLGSDATRPERVSDHDIPVGYFTFPPPQADLSATVSAASPVLSGTLQTYTVGVTNHGPDQADHAAVTFSIPDHTTFQTVTRPAGWTCTSTASQVSCKLPSLAANATAQFTIDVAVDCSTAGGTTISSTVKANSDYGDPNPADNTATATSIVSNPAPVITPMSADPKVLWPPNHKMVDVWLSYSVTDNCGTPNTAVVVTSSQPSNATGDGNTAVDWEVVNDHHVRLRAERAPDSSAGRAYSITVQATDSANNTSSRSVTVSVPR